MFSSRVSVARGAQADRPRDVVVLPSLVNHCCENAIRETRGHNEGQLGNLGVNSDRRCSLQLAFKVDELIGRGKKKWGR